jgi:hypothetical protein
VQAALEANPQHPVCREVYHENRELLTATLLDLGEHAAAAEAAADLARIAFGPANDLYKVAGFLARCIPLGHRDAKLAEAKREQLAQTYADRAMELLRQAVARGYKSSAHMKMVTELEPLRGREDFKELLIRLEQMPR